MFGRVYFCSILVNAFPLYAWIFTREISIIDAVWEDGNYTGDEIYDQIPNIGPQQCYLECKRNAICKFVGYDRKKYICHLFNRHINSNTKEQDETFVFIYDNTALNSKGAMEGPCRENDCLKGERCDVLTTSNSAVCMKTGCRHKQYSFDNSTRTCYRPVVAQTLSWANAEAFCRNDGGHLISLDTNAKNILIAQVLQNFVYPRFWIGFNDIEEEGKFVWVNTGSLHSLDKFTSWSLKQPNNEYFNSSLNSLQKTADCCVTKNDGLWWDDNCEDLNPFICEITL